MQPNLTSVNNVSGTNFVLIIVLVIHVTKFYFKYIVMEEDTMGH